MSAIDKKSYNGCASAYFHDEGYSNYTVENTVFECLKNLHPDGEFDRFYGEDERLDYAEKCAGFEDGDAIHMDCDRKDKATLTEDQRARLKLAGIEL